MSLESLKSPVWTFVSNLPLPPLPTNLVKWIPGSSPLSTHTEVITLLIGYIVVIFSGQYFMTDRKALRLQPLFMVHNALLSAGSGLLLALMLEEIIPIVWQHGPFYAICHTNAWTPRLETFMLINYYFKSWELADTFFLVVKKKPLMFLHYFHHSATLALCYVQLNGRTSVSWVPITLNLTVHVLMYYYYFMTAAGYKIWWKKYLTTLQISQFIIDLVVVYFAAYSYFAAEYFPGVLPAVGSCAGTEGAAIFGCGLLTSYLILFIAFYQRTYAATVKAKAQKAAKKSTAMTDFKKSE